MRQYIRLKIEFTDVWQCCLKDGFKFSDFHMPVLDEKKQIVIISVCTAIHFAEGDAVRIGDIDI